MANISTTDLPSPASTYTKTTQTVENYTLKSGRVYKIEAWGAKGGIGGSSQAGGGAGGNGSHSIGWYDMRTSANVTAQIFAGGIGGTNGAGWGATSLSANMQGTPGGTGYSNGGGGGGASGIYVGATAILIAGGGGGGGGGGSGARFGGSGGGTNGEGGNHPINSVSGQGATQSAHGRRAESGAASKTTSGTVTGGGNGQGGAGGGAGGGYTQGFAGGGGGFASGYGSGGGGGGSGGTSYIGGVQSLKDTPGKATTTWAHSGATGNGKVIITEYIMAVNVASPSNGAGYTVSAPSKTSALFGESYTFTITRTIGTGHVGLQLNTTNGTLALNTTNGNVFTYTVSNVQGTITSTDFSVTTYNVKAPPNDEGYTISNLSSTNVLRGGSYTFTITLSNGYANPFVKLNTPNGKVNYSGIDMNTLTITISNVQGIISADDFSITVANV